MGIKEVIIKKSKWKKDEKKIVRAEPITPLDDAFHGTFNFLDIEWWYFDAIFDNGYSVHVGVRTFHTKHHGVVKLRIELYKGGKVLAEVVKSDLFERFLLSPNFPSVKHNKDSIIFFDIDHFKKTGEWRYHVSLTINEYAVNLIFTGLTQGWKFETPENSWAVALPTAQVQGTLTIHDQIINVKGIGYHDHNWDYCITTAVVNSGWYWGRITGNTLNVIWAKTIKDQRQQRLLAVVSQKNQSLQKNMPPFINIDQKHLSLWLKNYQYEHRRWIPTEFQFHIKNASLDKTIPIQANLSMKVIDVQHSRIFTAHYWRYHVSTTGSISIGNQSEIFDNSPQIVEFLSFKPIKKSHEESLLK